MAPDEDESLAGEAMAVEAPSEPVKVAVRVRPLNDHERSLSAVQCISAESDRRVRMFHADNSFRDDRLFKFDHVFGSSSTQEDLHRALGLSLVNATLAGCDACLFAYGMTGSGKTYSMTGMSDMLFASLFRGIDERVSRDPGLRVSVTVSYAELYNEQLKDLLVLPGGNFGLKSMAIRETSDGGVYVKGLTEHTCNSCEELVKIKAMGEANRKVAGHRLNARSSRSHAIFALKLVISAQDEFAGNMQPLVSGRMHLVDLAGSERLSKTCMADPEMVKEACSINKSLGALGEVISKLAARHRADHIPFRNSKLTRLLQESLSSSASFTVMLATVSPADVHMDETLQTLQYATRAKAIANKACPGARACRALRVHLLEAKALRAEVAALQNVLKMGGGVEHEEEKRCLAVKRRQLVKTLAKAEDERTTVRKAWEAALGGDEAERRKISEIRHASLRRMKIAEILGQVLGPAAPGRDVTCADVQAREELLVSSTRAYEEARDVVVGKLQTFLCGMTGLCEEGDSLADACLRSGADLLPSLGAMKAPKEEALAHALAIESIVIALADAHILRPGGRDDVERLAILEDLTYTHERVRGLKHTLAALPDGASLSDEEVANLRSALRGMSERHAECLPQYKNICLVQEGPCVGDDAVRDLVGIVCEALGIVVCAVMEEGGRAAARHAGTVSVATSPLVGLDECVEYVEVGRKLGECRDALEWERIRREELEGDVKGRDEEVAYLITSVQERDAEVASLVACVQEKDAEMAKRDAALATRDAEVESLKVHLQESRTQAAFLTAETESLTARVLELEGDAERALQEREGKISGLTLQLAVAFEEISETREACKRAEAELDHVSDERDSLLVQVKAQDQRCQALAAELGMEEGVIAALRAELSEAREKNEALTDECGRMCASLVEANTNKMVDQCTSPSQLESLAQERMLQARYEEAQADIDQVRKKLVMLEEDNKALNQELACAERARVDREEAHWRMLTQEGEKMRLQFDQLEHAQQLHAQLEQETAKMREEREELGRKLEESRKECSVLSEECVSVRLLLAQADERRVALISEHELLMAKMQGVHEQVCVDLAEARGMCVTLNKEADEMRQHIKSLDDQKLEVKAKEEVQQQETAKMREEREELGRKLEESRKECSVLSEECVSVRLLLTQADERRVALISEHELLMAKMQGVHEQVCVDLAEARGMCVTLNKEADEMRQHIKSLDDQKLEVKAKEEVQQQETAKMREEREELGRKLEELQGVHEQVCVDLAEARGMCVILNKEADEMRQHIKSLDDQKLEVKAKEEVQQQETAKMREEREELGRKLEELQGVHEQVCVDLAEARGMCVILNKEADEMRQHIKSLDDQKLEVKAKEEVQQQETAKMREEREELGRKLEELQGVHEQVCVDLAEARGMCVTLNKEADEMRQHIKSLDDQKLEVKAKEEVQQQETAKMREEREELGRKLQESRKECSVLSEECVSVRLLLTQADERRVALISEHELLMAKMQGVHEQVCVDLAEARGMCVTLNKEADEMRQHIKSLDDQKLEVKAKEEVQQQETAKMREEREELGRKLEELQGVHEQVCVDLAQARGMCVTLNKEADEMRQHIKSLCSEKDGAAQAAQKLELIVASSREEVVFMHKEKLLQDKELVAQRGSLEALFFSVSRLRQSIEVKDHEMQVQAGALQNAMADALELRQQLQNKEVEIQALTSVTAKAQDAVSACEKELEGLSSQVEELRCLRNKDKEELRSVRESLNGTTRELEQHRKDKEELKGKMKELKVVRESLTVELASRTACVELAMELSSKRFAGLIEGNRLLEESVACKAAECERARKEIHELREEKMGLAAALSDKTEENLAGRSKLLERNAELRGLYDELQSARGTLEELTREAEKSRAEVVEWRAKEGAEEQMMAREVEQLTQQLAAARQQIALSAEEGEQEVAFLTQRLADQECEAQSLKATLAQKEEMIQDLRTDLEAFKHANSDGWEDAKESSIVAFDKFMASITHETNLAGRRAHDPVEVGNENVGVKRRRSSNASEDTWPEQLLASEGGIGKRIATWVAEIEQKCKAQVAAKEDERQELVLQLLEARGELENEKHKRRELEKVQQQHQPDMAPIFEGSCVKTTNIKAHNNSCANSSSSSYCPLISQNHDTSLAFSAVCADQDYSRGGASCAWELSRDHDSVVQNPSHAHTSPVSKATTAAAQAEDTLTHYDVELSGGALQVSSIAGDLLVDTRLLNQKRGNLSHERGLLPHITTENLYKGQRKQGTMEVVPVEEEGSLSAVVMELRAELEEERQARAREESRAVFDLRMLVDGLEKRLQESERKERDATHENSQLSSLTTALLQQVERLRGKLEIVEAEKEVSQGAVARISELLEDAQKAAGPSGSGEVENDGKAFTITAAVRDVANSWRQQFASAAMHTPRRLRLPSRSDVMATPPRSACAPPQPSTQQHTRAARCLDIGSSPVTPLTGRPAGSSSCSKVPPIGLSTPIPDGDPFGIPGDDRKAPEHNTWNAKSLRGSLTCPRRPSSGVPIRWDADAENEGENAKMGVKKLMQKPAGNVSESRVPKWMRSLSLKSSNSPIKAAAAKDAAIARDVCLSPPKGSPAGRTPLSSRVSPRSSPTAPFSSKPKASAGSRLPLSPAKALR